MKSIPPPWTNPLDRWGERQPRSSQIPPPTLKYQKRRNDPAVGSMRAHARLRRAGIAEIAGGVFVAEGDVDEAD